MSTKNFLREVYYINKSDYTQFKYFGQSPSSVGHGKLLSLHRWRFYVGAAIKKDNDVMYHSDTCRHHATTFLRAKITFNTTSVS